MFAFENNSSSVVTRIDGRGILQVGGIDRFESLSTTGTLLPNALRTGTVDIELHPENEQDKALESVPLEQIKISWITDYVALCDGQCTSFQSECA